MWQCLFVWHVSVSPKEHALTHFSSVFKNLSSFSIADQTEDFHSSPQRCKCLFCKSMLSLFPLQAFLHRIRQTADDQQCLSPEQVKVGLEFVAPLKDQVSRSQCWKGFLFMYDTHQYICLYSPHLPLTVGHFLAPPTPGLFIFSFLWFLPTLHHSFVYRFCFQILRTSWSCTARCCLQWRAVCSLNPTLSMHWDMCSSSL